MLNTIKLKFNAYKWAIIVGLFAIMAIAIVIQYHQTSTLRVEQLQLIEDKKELENSISEISTNFNNYKEDVDAALIGLSDLRTEINDITSQTNTIKRQLKGLGKAPSADGSNRQEIEDQANKISNDLFNRIQMTSTGDGK